MSTNTANLTNYHPSVPQRTAADYADIIHLKRPQAPNPMSIAARAAQFSPYAALIGHKDVVAADEELASTKIDLDHDIIVEYEE